MRLLSWIGLLAWNVVLTSTDPIAILAADLAILVGRGFGQNGKKGLEIIKSNTVDTGKVQA